MKVRVFPVVPKKYEKKLSLVDRISSSSPRLCTDGYSHWWIPRYINDKNQKGSYIRHGTSCIYCKTWTPRICSYSDQNHSNYEEF